jgi:hypothetical protein
MTVEALAAALLALSSADRNRLAALLVANPATAPCDASKPAGDAEGPKAT